MRVFISSVRRGLEVERDALPGLIRAVGHEPVRFEDFTALSEPSREVCLRAVESSDLVLLLLGPNYGHRFPETNQSPTEDEWIEATRLGRPRLVFVKEGTATDPDQTDFIRRIGEYRDGVFYNRFSDTADLLTKVAEAVRSAAERPSALVYQPLSVPTPKVGWLPARGMPGGLVVTPLLEVHVIPVPGNALSARRLTQLSMSLPGMLRALGRVPHTAPLDCVTDAGSVTTWLPQPTRGWNDVAAGSIAGLRVSKDGQVAVFASLPRDSMGPVLDASVLPGQIADMLRLVGAANLVSEVTVAVAVGLSSTSLVSLDSVARMPRSTASLGSSRKPPHVEPDEIMTSAALSSASNEAAVPLAQALITSFNRG